MPSTIVSMCNKQLLHCRIYKISIKDSLNFNCHDVRRIYICVNQYLYKALRNNTY